jgi:hypothetical protein
MAGWLLHAATKATSKAQKLFDASLGTMGCAMVMGAEASASLTAQARMTTNRKDEDLPRKIALRPEGA